MATIPSQRYAACVEYCGVAYAGWQRQKNAASVQQVVEEAISRVANHEIRIITAGRTDSGVHSIGQIIHFDSPSQRSSYEWRRGVNTWLPNDISLIWTKPVNQDFHARFGAIQRWYRYIILNREVSPSYLHGRVTWYRPILDVNLMQKAANHLVGQHDFSAFRATGCQSKNPVKEIRQLTISREGHWIWFDVIGDGFLHHMVRNIVGVLAQIGTAEQKPEWATEVLHSKDRTCAGVTFPADGLYFVQVDYDPQHDLPPPPPVCRFW